MPARDSPTFTVETALLCSDQPSSSSSSMTICTVWFSSPVQLTLSQAVSASPRSWPSSNLHETALPGGGPFAAATAAASWGGVQLTAHLPSWTAPSSWATQRQVPSRSSCSMRTTTFCPSMRSASICATCVAPSETSVCAQTAVSRFPRCASSRAATASACPGGTGNFQFALTVDWLESGVPCTFSTSSQAPSCSTSTTISSGSLPRFLP